MATPSSPPLRIGLLTPAWPGTSTPNGIVASTFNLASGLAENGEAPVILARKIDATPPARPPHVLLPPPHWTLAERLQARIGRRQKAYRAVTQRRLVSAIQEAKETHGLDLVVLEESFGWGAGLSRRIGLPVVVVLRGPWFLHAGFSSTATSADQEKIEMEAEGIADATALMAPSQDVMDKVVAKYGLADKPKHISPNPAPVIDGPDASTHNTRHILFIGRFDRHKGGDIALEAFARIAKRHPEARLTFVGPDRGVIRLGQGSLFIQDALDALDPDIRSRIDWRGPLPRDEVFALRQQHPIALIASRYENFGNVGLEAMAAGQAIVCTETGGFPEMMTDDKTALLVPPEDPEAMATALGRLLDDGDLRRRLGQAARLASVDTFGRVAIARHTAAFFRDIVTNGGRS